MQIWLENINSRSYDSATNSFINGNYQLQLQSINNDIISKKQPQS